MSPEEIRQRREDLGLTRDEFAKRLGITGDQRRSTVSRWETGKRLPSPQTIMLINRLRDRRK